MKHFSSSKLLLLIFILIAAACAPADLDITPTATSTPSPTPRPTQTPTPTPDPSNAGQATDGTTTSTLSNEEIVDLIVDAVPNTLPAGAIEWRRNFDVPVSVAPRTENGIAKRVELAAPGGGVAVLTFGTFDTPDDALTYYDFIKELRTVLENGEPMENFPEPNLAASGTYGSNAIFQVENNFVEISVEQFSSTAGNPIPGLSRRALEVLESGLEAVTEAGSATEATGTEGDTGDTTASAEVDPSQLLLDSIMVSVPDVVGAGVVEWRKDLTREPQALANITNGQAVRVFFAERQGGESNITYGVFDTPEDANTYFEFIKDLRTSLETGEPNDAFPQPNLFGSGLYGNNSIFQVDNIFVEVSVPLFSSTQGNPLPGLSRQAINILEAGQALAEAGGAVEEIDANHAQLNAILAAIPEDFASEVVSLNIENGAGASIETEETTVNIAVFETDEEAAQYLDSADEGGTIRTLFENIFISVQGRDIGLVAENVMQVLEAIESSQVE